MSASSATGIPGVFLRVPPAPRPDPFRVAPEPEPGQPTIVRELEVVVGVAASPDGRRLRVRKQRIAVHAGRLALVGAEVEEDVPLIRPGGQPLDC